MRSPCQVRSRSIVTWGTATALTGRFADRIDDNHTYPTQNASDTTMKMSTVPTPLRHPFLLLALLIGLLAGGCEDRLLPPDDDNDSTGAATGLVAYNKFFEDDALPYPIFMGIALVDSLGIEREFLQTKYQITSPSGNGLVAVIDTSGRGIDLIDLEEGKIVRNFRMPVGDDINYYSAAISPQGDRIAYSIEYDDGATTNESTRRIHIVKTDGSNPITLNVGAGHESFVRFSPDGSRVAFFDATADRSGWLYVARVDGSDVRKIADVGRVAHDGYMTFAWSPDGEEIVYSDFENDEFQLVVAAVDGSGTRLLGVNGMAPDWSPDGASILYASETGLAVTAADGTGGTRNLGLYAIFSTWSPDSRKILCFEVDPGIDLDQQMPQLVVIDAATSARGPVTESAYYGYWYR